MSVRIDQLMRDCSADFEALVEQLEKDAISDFFKGTELKHFKNEQSRLIRWSQKVGAQYPGEKSLEQRLQNAQHVKLQTIRLLSNIQRLIQDAISITTGEKVPWDRIDDDEETTSDDENHSQDRLPETEMEQILAHIKELIDNLSYLGGPIGNAAPGNTTMGIPEDESTPSEPFDIQHVRSKHPMLDQAIAERLGKAISIRRKLFKDRKDGQDQGQELMTLDSDRVSASPTLESLTSQLELANLAHMTEEYPETRREISPGTSCSSSQILLIPDRIPDLPNGAIEGNPFRCVGCDEMIQVASKVAWKKHFYQDLRPYLCLEEDCSTPHYRYARRRDWMSHLLREHWTIYICPFGCDLRFTSRNECREHLRDQHSYDMAPAEIEDLVQLSTFNETEIPRNLYCALCKMRLEDVEEFRSHVDEHQRELALFAMPRRSRRKYPKPHMPRRTDFNSEHSPRNRW
ncbi:uncharacterized protein FMAN_04008 [Fusarium mangiferae]|uniref:C2H2-type domain-containing protein n=1 Tax=Fusarium mangiferae TaxID=192010 RepID=A0A1L7T135_FUSMA|nr:uncharacterized protein FMAN_04008 [Fusarium mangiferae]CVK89853.1 uncharacterized protein FMAN_04008 [Fusarium mangiferae]